MPIASFYSNVAAYKTGHYELIEYFDLYSQETVKLHPKQIQALRIWNNNTTKYIGYGGAARGGKTALLCLIALFECYAYPDTRHLIARKELKNLLQTTWITMERLLQNFGFVQDVDYRHNQQRQEVNFYHRGKFVSKIILFNAEYQPRDPDITRLGSLEITRAYVDQSEQIHAKVVEKIGERVGTYNNHRYHLPGKVFESFNPSKTHVYYNYWIPYKENRETDNRRFIHALPSDNPGLEAQRWLAEKIRDYKAGDMSETEYQRQVEGNFEYDTDPDALIDTLALSQSFRNDHLVDAAFASGIKCITADIALRGNDDFVLCVWMGKVLVDMLVIPKCGGKEVVDMIQSLARKWGVEEQHIVYDADGLGGFIGGEGAFLPKAKAFKNGSRPPFVKSRNYRYLKDMCGYLLASAINAGEYYFLAANRDIAIKSRAIAELEQLKRSNSDKDLNSMAIVGKDIIKEILGHSPDFLDAFMMREYLHFALQTWTGEAEHS